MGTAVAEFGRSRWLICDEALRSSWDVRLRAEKGATVAPYWMTIGSPVPPGHGETSQPARAISGKRFSAPTLSGAR
jgi:hypothetical protein